MKKFLFLILAVLLLAGPAFAQSVLIDPNDGPMISTVPVYNNDTVTLGTGSVVIWDIGSSTGDNDNWVKTTTTADTFLVAGVVYPAPIASGKTGTIAVYGIVECDAASTIPAGDCICTTTTGGQAARCSTPAEDSNRFGFAINTISSGVTGEKCFVTLH